MALTIRTFVNGDGHAWEIRDLTGTLMGEGWARTSEDAHAEANDVATDIEEG